VVIGWRIVIVGRCGIGRRRRYGTDCRTRHRCPGDGTGTIAITAIMVSAAVIATAVNGAAVIRAAAGRAVGGAAIRSARRCAATRPPRRRRACGAPAPPPREGAADPPPYQPPREGRPRHRGQGNPPTRRHWALSPPPTAHQERRSSAVSSLACFLIGWSWRGG